jgi:hypothetical protein
VGLFMRGVREMMEVTEMIHLQSPDAGGSRITMMITPTC